MAGDLNKKNIVDLLGTCNREDLVWLNGYISGLLKQGVVQDSTSTVKLSSKKITIAYGTESGNSKKLASEFVAKAKKHGISAKLVGLDQYRLNDLPKEEYFLTIVSTQGEGDPPASAKKFYDHIHNNGFQLERLKYGVLALGDTSYPLFCKAGEDVDLQLQKLGAQRIIPLQKCDTDYHADAEMWFSQVLKQFDGAAAVSPTTVATQVKKPSGKKIYQGTVLSAVNLNDRGSNKETFHIEIGAEDVEYLPGDSIGVSPKNAPVHVESILRLTGTDPEQTFTYRNGQHTAYSLLQDTLHILYLPARVIKKYAALVDQEIPDTRMGLEDLLKIYSLKSKEQFADLLQILEPLAPRLYSISSSPSAHEGEVHITVARNQFFCQEQLNYGLCSDYLSQFEVGSTLNFYIHHNNLFRLPEPSRDIIMIGPGTGIAPFRSFLFERDASNAPGRNWLFFGEQHFVTDFLYQSEIQQLNDSGLLTRVELAFSRDQEEKIYVQDKIRKRGADLYSWLENEAIVYICGSKEPMSRDVEQTFLEIVKEHGNKNDQETDEYFSKMKEEGRYLTDVY